LWNSMNVNKKLVPVVDLFSGPGGLGEGFSGLESKKGIFDVRVSVEKEASAAKTLLLRKFFREFSKVPDEYYQMIRGELSQTDLYALFPKEYKNASSKVWQQELGENEFTRNTLHEEIQNQIGGANHWVLIGGPPCQAYSIAGKARNKGIEGYVPSNDNRHFLYQEYLRVIERHWPSVFIMENVPGLLSTNMNGKPMFDVIKNDLRDPCRALKTADHAEYDGYRLYSLVEHQKQIDIWGDIDAKDFVVKSEEYGIPQARHRIVVIGVRSDIQNDPEILMREQVRTVEDVIGDLPKLRSGLSKGDSKERWLDVITSSGAARWWAELGKIDTELRDEIEKTISKIRVPRKGTGSMFIPSSNKPKALADWYHDPRLQGVCNHEARGHMDSDLHRYLFASSLVKLVESKVNKRGYDVHGAVFSKLEHFPVSLLPAHKNVKTTSNIKKVHFANRFQVQRAKAPSSTVVSHIAKDGHYFIHYDPSQCRALTVREAARLQTFPDNYFFCGNRTEQFTQVGNAVPPLLARKIAKITMNLLTDG
jgi:DNA (cytosine-5)-methyltransferase 1